MEKSYIFNQIKRCNRNLLLFNLVMLILILALFHRFYFNYTFGPFNLDSKAINSILQKHESGEKYYYQVRGKNVFNAGLIEKTEFSILDKKIKMDDKDSITGYYKIVFVDDKFVLAKISDDIKPKVLTGVLKPMKNELDIMKISKKTKKQFLNYILDTTYGYKVSRQSTLIVTVPFILLFLINILRTLYRIVKPTAHPLYKKIKKYFSNPEETIINIDKEVNGNRIVRRKNIIVTPSWIIKREFFMTKLTRNDKIKM